MSGTVEEALPPAVPAHVRRVVLALVAVLAVVGPVSTALSPTLIVEAPLLLVALSAVNRHIVLAAAHVDPVPLLLVGSARRMLSLLATYGLGYLYGAAALSWAEARHPRVARLVRWCEDWLQRVGPALLVVMSSYTLMGLAGATRMRLRTFLLASGLGNLIYVAAVVWLGDAVSAWSRPLLAWLARHLVEATVICIALVLAQQLWRRRRGASRITPPTDLSPPAP